jgi:16S rRNA (cytosine1402-N4)-methyltransferase
MLRLIGPDGRVIGLDLDAQNLERARERLTAVGHPFSLHHSNFAALPTILAAEGIDGVDALIADLGMSSMQVDDSERGFSYVRDGPLDMRMDRSRGRTAAQLLATISEQELGAALRELGDEPEAERIAAAIVEARGSEPLTHTTQLARLIQEACGQRDWKLHPSRGRWNLHPAARTFQVLRILVNRELANLEHLLRMLPACLRPGSTAALISFHSGEDRRIKAGFRDGLRVSAYARIAEDPLRPTEEEKQANPRARSAKLRWATK